MLGDLITAFRTRPIFLTEHLTRRSLNRFNLGLFPLQRFTLNLFFLDIRMMVRKTHAAFPSKAIPASSLDTLHLQTAMMTDPRIGAIFSVYIGIDEIVVRSTESLVTALMELFAACDFAVRSSVDFAFRWLFERHARW